MTGDSIPWKIIPIQLKSFLNNYNRPTSAMLIGGGCCLMLEHLFKYDRFDLLDFWGHEYLGFAMICVGFLLSIKWEQWRTLDLKHPRNWIR